MFIIVYNCLLLSEQLIEIYTGGWRNRLAQASYTHKVRGSSPLPPTKKCKVDGYDKEKNIVFEYDEKRHYKDVYNNILKDKDINRQNEIIAKLGCRFFRYNETIDLLYEVTLE